MGRKDKPREQVKAAAGGPKAGLLPPPTIPKKAEDDGSRFLAALAFGFMVLLASPTMTFESTETPLFTFSAIECAGAAITAHAPPLQPVAQWLLLPATFFRRLARVLVGCGFQKKVEMCDYAGLVDLRLHWVEADMTPLLQKLKAGVPEQHLNLLLGGAMIITWGALAGIIRPVKMSIIGFFMIVYAGYNTDTVGFLPSLLMETFLLGYSIFYNMFPDPDRGQGNQTGAAPAADGTAPGAGPSAPAAASPAAKPQVSAAQTRSTASKHKGTAANPYEI